MSAGFWHRVLPLNIVLAATAGCGAPLLFQVETVIHPDGSCDRTIWQPEKEMLPPEALAPAWKARWKSVDPVPIPPAFAGEFQASNAQKYFRARGLVSCPGGHPRPLPVSLLPMSPSVGASELSRSYDREDFGFVVEHRFTETLTNIVTPVGFLQARDEFLDRALPLLIQGVEQVYGGVFDVKGLTKYLREDGRRFLEEAAIVYYELAALHKKEEEQALAFAELAKRFGLDLFDSAGKLVEGDEANTRFLAFFRHRIVLGIRHRDGPGLTEAEIQSVIQLERQHPLRERLGVLWQTGGKGTQEQAAAVSPADDRAIQLSLRDLHIAVSPVCSGASASRRACRDQRVDQRPRPHELEVRWRRILSRRLRDEGAESRD